MILLVVVLEGKKRVIESRGEGNKRRGIKKATSKDLCPKINKITKCRSA